MLKQAAQAARESHPSIPDDIHCHMLRKAKAMDLYQQGIPLPIIMRLLGREDASTTSAFYAFATMDMMRDAINAATPAVNSPAADPLAEDRLQALYRLRCVKPRKRSAIAAPRGEATIPRLNAKLGLIRVKPKSA